VTLVRTEQIKLTATYLNGIAITVFGIGGLTIPFNLYSSAALTASPWIAATISVVCFAASAVLHLAGKRVLRELVE
jgi:hypothetical protein